MDGLCELLGEVRAGHRHASARLYEEFTPHLLRVAQSLLGPAWPRESVSDLTQQTWLRALAAIDQFEGGLDDAQTAALFRAWTASILRNTWLNGRLRRPPSAVALGTAAENSAAGVDVAAGDPTPSCVATLDEECRRVREAVEDLPEKLQQDVVRLYLLDETPLGEVARRLGVTYDQVRYAWKKARTGLARRLEFLR